MIYSTLYLLVGLYFIWITYLPELDDFNALTPNYKTFVRLVFLTAWPLPLVSYFIYNAYTRLNK